MVSRIGLAETGLPVRGTLKVGWKDGVVSLVVPVGPYSQCIQTVIQPPR